MGLPTQDLKEPKDLKADFLKHLSTLSNGAYYLQPEDQANALDYIKDAFIEKEQFSQIAEEELSDTILGLIKPYIDADNGSRIIAYGSRFPNGIHDIHMNQGYPHSSLPSYQDGALILYDAINDTYEGLFFIFTVKHWRFNFGFFSNHLLQKQKGCKH